MSNSRQVLDPVKVSGHMSCAIITPDPDAAIIEGVEWEQGWVKNEDGLWECKVGRDNAFLLQGLSNMLDRYLASIATPVYRIGASSDNLAVTAATTQFGGTTRFAPMNATFPSHAAGTALASFQGDFTKGAGAAQIDFSVRKLGVTTAAADTAGAVQDIIGGAGVAPYNEPLTIDLTSTTSFTMRPQIDILLVAV